MLQPIVDGQPAARTSLETAHYTAAEAPSTPGGVQQPLPLTIAAGGPKGLRLAALYGRNWVTVGPTGHGPGTPEMMFEAMSAPAPPPRRGLPRRRPGPVEHRADLLWTPTETVITSVDQFDELVGPCAELGLTSSSSTTPPRRGRTRATSRRREDRRARRRLSDSGQRRRRLGRTAARADAGSTRSTSTSVQPTHDAASATARATGPAT